MSSSCHPISFLKRCFSVALLLLSIVLVSALIFHQQTRLSQDVQPALAFIILWGALIWLSMVEGSQAAMVGLAPVDRRLYKETHPISYQICEYSHQGDNLDRYLMGRQFMVCALVFLINMAGAPITEDVVLVKNLSSPLMDVLVKSGLALILVTAMFGQLSKQMNASHCQLDFLNTHFATLTVYVAMGIEASGLLHVSYLVRMIVARCAGKEVETNEAPRTKIQSVLFWGHVLFSVTLLMFAFVVTFVAIVQGKTTVWEGVSPLLAGLLLVGLIVIIGMLEGMQVAFSAVSQMSREERGASAQRACDLLFREDGRALSGFMIGRQVCVVSCFFLMARLTTIKMAPEDEGNILGVSDGVQKFFETGFLGALITANVASIAWQLVASTFPLAFLGNPLAYFLLRLCLLVEATGMASGSWVLAALHEKLTGFHDDEVYIETEDERAASGHGDTPVYEDDMGHLIGGAFPANHELPAAAVEATSFAMFSLCGESSESSEEEALAQDDPLLPDDDVELGAATTL